MSSCLSAEWQSIKALLTEEAGKVFGCDSTKSTDWYAENVSYLSSLLDALKKKKQLNESSLIFTVRKIFLLIIHRLHE